MSLDAAIEAEAQAQAICMQTRDFERAYDAFVVKTGKARFRRGLMLRATTSWIVAVLRGPRTAASMRRAPTLRQGRRSGPDRRPTATSVLTCARRIVKALGSGWLAPSRRRLKTSFDVRSLCLIRETLAHHHGLADFAFAMQGLGSAPIGYLRLGRRSKINYLPPTAASGDADRSVRPYRSRKPARTSAGISDHRRRSRAMTPTSSTARRRGSRTVASRTTTSYSRAPKRVGGDGNARLERLRRRQGHSRVQASKRRSKSSPPTPWRSSSFERLPGPALASSWASAARGCEIALGHARRVPLDASAQQPSALLAAALDESPARAWRSRRTVRPKDSPSSSSPKRDSPRCSTAIDATRRCSSTVPRGPKTPGAERVSREESVDGKDVRDRSRAESRRRRGPTIRRRGRRQRQRRRAPLPRSARAPHLRRHHRDPQAHHRATYPPGIRANA